MSVLSSRLDQTPFAVVDFETTGLDPRIDRVVEVAVRRFDPRTGSVQCLDSLVNPSRPIGATQLHGIRADDVRDAPTFAEIAPSLIDLLSGAVLASYNVLFDVGFLRSELQRLGIDGSGPHVCLMLMKPLLGLGHRCSLPDACIALGVAFDGDHHIAADDAEAAERLLRRYLQECARRQVVTFDDLRGLGGCDFLQTLTDPLLRAMKPLAATGTRYLSRRDWLPARRAIPDEAAVKTYFDALVAVMVDSILTDDELAYMQDLQARLRLTPEQIRALHARAFLCIMINSIGDDWFDDRELATVNRASSCLSRLGWTPGGN